MIKDDLMQAAKEALELTITKPRLEQLISDGIIGRVLIKLGRFANLPLVGSLGMN